MKTDFEIIKITYAERYGFSIEEIEGSCREGMLPEVRARIIYAYKSKYPATRWRDIGRWIKMDHSSVSSAHQNMIDGIYGPETQTHEYKDFVNITYKGRYSYILTDKT